MNIILLGPPGSGKGTQAKKISDYCSIPHISTGDILRDNVSSKTELGLKAKSYMDDGKLVPDDILIEIIKERLSHQDCSDGFLLDGFPRTIPQANALKEILKNLKKTLDYVLNLDVDDEELIKRLSGRRVCSCGASYHIIFNPPKKQDICDLCGKKLYQREDDKEAAIRIRLDVYKKQTQPLIEFYENKNCLYFINGKKDISHVFEDIIKIIC